MHLWVRLKEKDFQKNNKILIILKGKLKSFTFSLDQQDRLKLCILRHWLIPQDNRMNTTTFFLHFQQFLFGCFYVRSLCCNQEVKINLNMNGKCHWLFLLGFFFFSDQNSLWLAFHVWFEIALKLNQKSGFSYAGWENKSREKNSCCLVCSFAELEPYLDLFSLWFVEQPNSTSNVNPHFCAVLLCWPWQGPAQGGDSGLIRLLLN